MGAILAFGGGLGCQGTPAPRSTPAAAVETRQATPTPERLPTLSADERSAAENIRRDVGQLDDEIGRRSPDSPWQLLEAADYISAQLEALGYEPERQGYEIDDLTLFNVSVTITGGRDFDQVLVVGTHYDSPPGREAGNAVSAAALLELARVMHDAQLDRTLKLVFFALGEPPHGQGAARGARQFAGRLSEDSTREAPEGIPEPLRASREQETLGAILLQSWDDLRSCPDGHLSVSLSKTSGSNHLSSALAEALDEDFIEAKSLEDSVLSDSNSTAFFEVGIPAVTLRGTAPCEKKLATESPESEDAARLVGRVRRAIAQILGEKPRNDGMLTLPTPSSR